ncbi:MAG: aminotransferase class I/II-fold pyridoxal phosphate-dependent enzyme, partial [Limnobacter sp.]|nr:aminotransferase class I/II-fold pyridoxal phosphate-dependent enzyme [Limnobacter sp.]
MSPHPDAPPSPSLNACCHKQLNALGQAQLYRQLPNYGGQSGMVDFSSNDYLGLAHHPEVIAAGQTAAHEFGAGATGSRLLSGNLSCFEALENQVAQFKGTQAALVFSSGYQANSTALAALLSSNVWGTAPLVLTDRLIHASLHHACQLAGVKQVRFAHNDLNHLEQCLKRHRKPGQPALVITETVFGMDGDQLDVAALAEL